MVIFLAYQTMSAQSLHRAGWPGRLYKRPIPLLMDKAQKSEKTNCSNGPQDAKSLETTIQAQMVIFLAALCVAAMEASMGMAGWGDNPGPQGRAGWGSQGLGRGDNRVSCETLRNRCETCETAPVTLAKPLRDFAKHRETACATLAKLRETAAQHRETLARHVK